MFQLRQGNEYQEFECDYHVVQMHEVRIDGVLPEGVAVMYRMTDEYTARRELEGKAMDEVLVECRKCGVSNCYAPCGIAKTILNKYGLEYKGDKPCGE
jgi:hypothetical protein